MSLDSREVPYLERSGPLRIILGSFFFITIPLTVMVLAPVSADVKQLFFYVFAIHAAGLGTTHFVITGAIYLQRDNLEYFRSSAKHRLIYFGVPIAIFALFGLMGATSFELAYPLVAAGFFATIRIFDFTHVTRQSFGMVQLLKAPARGLLPAWTRDAENYLFLGLAVLQMATFLYGGDFDWSKPALRGGVLVVGTLFVVVFGTYLRAIVASEHRKGLSIALAYLTLQVISASLAVYMTVLYVISLTMHYAEYHVMMRQRCFAGERDQASRVDTLMSWFGTHQWVFYGGILALAFFFKFGSPALLSQTPDAPETFPLRFFLHFFGGLSLAHFFVEAFLWKFSQPFYRKTLAPLYG